MGFLMPTQGNAFFFPNIASRRPRIKYQERSAMGRELEELYGFFNNFPELDKKNNMKRIKFPQHNKTDNITAMKRRPLIIAYIFW